MLPALAATIISGTSYVEYFSHLGSSTKATALAIVVALAVGGGYMACVHALLKGAAKLPPHERARITPVITAVWIIISLASAFPILINAGKGIATNASAAAYITEVMAKSDQLKAGALAFDQVGPVLDNGVAALDGLSAMEAEGIYSGTASEGALARWVAGFAERLRDARTTIAPASERTQELVSRIDRATDQMRRSLIDPELNLKQRRAALQRAGDDVRTAMLTLKQAAPVAALKNLAASLRAEQALPKLSSNNKIRRGQEKGVRRITTELRRIGRDLERRVEDMAAALKVRIPAYQLPPDSVLVLSNLQAVPHVAAMAFGLDALPFALYLIVARLYDAERAARVGQAARGSQWRTGPSMPNPNAPLGAHPYPNATRSRTGKDRNGLDAEPDNADQ